jgi:anti-sigma factor RsiW
MSELHIAETDLLAYADGKLPPARRAEVDAWLTGHPERAAEVFAWERQNETISALYDPVAAAAVPARLNPHRLAATDSRPTWRGPAMAAAAVVVLGLGLGVGWFGHDVLRRAETPEQLLVDNAVAAHALYVRENRHAVEVASTDQQLLTWLSNRIRAPINAPDLAPQGFNFIGGRLLPPGHDTDVGPAAQLMYENGSAERVTVYITSALPSKANAYEFVTRNGLDAFYWANAQITCTVVGDLPPDDMKMVARSVYQQLTRRPDYMPPGRG